MTTPVRPEARQLSAARGFLSAALDMIEPTHMAVLDISAAWSHLDEPGRHPEITDYDPRPGDGPDALIAQARAVLYDAIAVSVDPTRTLAIAQSIRELDMAADTLGNPRNAALSRP